MSAEIITTSPSLPAVTTKVLTVTFLTWVIAQLLTGIETGVLTVALMGAMGWRFHEALALAITLGYPLLLVQLGLVGAALGRAAQRWG